MDLFLYEYVTGGGLLETAEPADCPLLAEGRAMLAALAEDLARLPDTKVRVLRDGRLPAWHAPQAAIVVKTAAEHTAAFDQMAAACDWTLLIAPETGGALYACAARVAAVGGRLLGPDLPLIALASDKHATCEHLRDQGVPVPLGRAIEPGQPWPLEWPLPAVCKPRDGAGSCGVRLLRQWPASDVPADAPGGYRLECHCPGLAASVAAIAGPAGHVLLPACTQHLTQDGCFCYLGGSVLQDPHLTARAHRLVRQALLALPQPRGYLGFDLVLGERPADDVVIEINPRPTTSYVGLRHAVAENLAEVLLAAVCGQCVSVRPLAWPISFTATGEVYPEP